MATISPGTGSTFRAITAEGRAIEALIFTQIQEQDEAHNPNGLNYVLGSFDSDDNTFSGTYSLPAVQSISSDGSLKIEATAYLQSVDFTPGTGTPTFKSTVLERYLLEVLMYLQYLERQPEKNLQNRNWITGSFNSDTGLYQGTFNLPVNLALGEGGKVEFSAQEYLQT